MRYLVGLICVLALPVLGLAACGDGNGSESANVAGDWEMTSTVVTDNCDGRTSQTFPMTITQEGNNLAVETSELTFSGTIHGNQIQMSGSFAEDGGTVTVNATLTVYDDANSMQGSDSWTWTDGSESCSGSDSLSAIRITTGQGFPCTEQGIRDAIAEGEGPHFFACHGPMTVVAEAEIVIDNDVSLDGEGKLTIDANASHRVLSVLPGVTAELSGVMLTNGAVSNDNGGGILNQGALTLTDCTISANSAEVGVDGFGDGGGIFNEGTLTLTDCTVSGNFAGDDGGGVVNTGLLADPEQGLLSVTNSTVSANAARFGGGIWNGKTATVTNSTVSENSAADFGGGIDNGRTPTTFTMTNCTVSGNTAGVAGDAFFAATATLTSTIVDGTCDGPLTSNGHNIESPGDTCGFDTNKGDQVNVTAEQLNLGPLADNGGPTMTHALLTEPVVSVGIDVILAEDCVDAHGQPLTIDQRRDPRPAGTTDPKKCDVGAYEVQP
jgi:hypothetical protein